MISRGVKEKIINDKAISGFIWILTLDTEFRFQAVIH